MGKVLIINGADFSANAIGQIEPSYNVPVKKTQFGVFFMDYNGECEIKQLKSSSTAAPYSKLLVANVSNYIGKTIKVTSATPIVEGAYYCAFTSDLGTFDFDDIPSLSSLSSSKDTAVTSVGELFNVSSNDKVKATVNKVIPLGAKYLLVTIRTDGGMAESEAGVVIDLE